MSNVADGFQSMEVELRGRRRTDRWMGGRMDDI